MNKLFGPFFGYWGFFYKSYKRLLDVLFYEKMKVTTQKISSKRWCCPKTFVQKIARNQHLF